MDDSARPFFFAPLIFGMDFQLTQHPVLFSEFAFIPSTCSRGLVIFSEVSFLPDLSISQCASSKVDMYYLVKLLVKIAMLSVAPLKERFSQ